MTWQCFCFRHGKVIALIYSENLLQRTGNNLVSHCGDLFTLSDGFSFQWIYRAFNPPWRVFLPHASFLRTYFMIHRYGESRWMTHWQTHIGLLWVRCVRAQISSNLPLTVMTLHKPERGGSANIAAPLFGLETNVRCILRHDFFF